MTEPQLGGTYQQILAAARFAETEGLTSFARSDHWYWEGEPTAATDAFATLAGLARDTETVRLCVLVSPITFRHPAVIAKNAATIDEMSGGRLDLGVGTGWNVFEHKALGLDFPEDVERWGRFEDALGYLKAAFAPGDGRHDGEFYSLDADLKPKPSGMRLIVGGTGPKRTPRIAGTYADEYNTLITTAKEVVSRIAVMRRSADGRPVEVTMMGQVFVGRTDAEYRKVLDSAAARDGVSPEDLETRWRESGQIFGPPGHAAEQIAALEEVGVERIYLQWLDLADYDGMAAMVEAMRDR